MYSSIFGSMFGSEINCKATLAGIMCCAGLENYTCVAYKLYSYATNLEGPASFFTADSLYVVTTQSERYFAQVGESCVVELAVLSVRPARQLVSLLVG